MHSEPIFILRRVMKMVIKGTWSHFSLHLVSTKIKWKALKPHFHGCDKYEKGIKQNSVIILSLFRECDNNPNDALNLFSCFCKIEKDKICLCVLFHLLESTRKNKSLLGAVLFHGLASTRKNKSLLGDVLFHGLTSMRKNKSLLGGAFRGKWVSSWSLSNDESNSKSYIKERTIKWLCAIGLMELIYW